MIIFFQNENRFHEDIFGVTLKTYEVQNKVREKLRVAWKGATGTATAAKLSVVVGTAPLVGQRLNSAIVRRPMLFR